MPIGKA
jgi:hypothetical protein